MHWVTLRSLLAVGMAVWIGCSSERPEQFSPKEDPALALASCRDLLGKLSAADSTTSCVNSMSRELAKVTPAGVCTGRVMVLDPGDSSPTRWRCVPQRDPHPGPHAEIELVMEAKRVSAVRLLVPYQDETTVARTRLVDRLARNCDRLDDFRYRCKTGLMIDFMPWGGEARRFTR